MIRYSYCWNQPTSYTDLNGRFPVLIVAAVLLASTAVAVDATAIHSINMMEEHYGRNKNQEDYFAQFDSEQAIIEMVELGEDGWVPAPSNQNAYHRFTYGSQGEEAVYNVKYLKVLPDGTSYEIIICQPEGNDYIVTDPINMGTYNYCNPYGRKGYVGHLWNDVVPYWYLSNTLNDDLKWYERLFGSSKTADTEPDYIIQRIEIKNKRLLNSKGNKKCLE